MINTRAFICGIKSLKLSKKEITFLRKYKPWGIILFSRNLKSIQQVKKLTTHIKKILKDTKFPILIDEEGGRVTRLKNFIENSAFSSEYFGNLFKKNINKFNLYYKVHIKQISYLLNQLGINIIKTCKGDAGLKFD